MGCWVDGGRAANGSGNDGVDVEAGGCTGCFSFGSSFVGSLASTACLVFLKFANFFLTGAVGAGAGVSVAGLNSGDAFSTGGGVGFVFFRGGAGVSSSVESDLRRRETVGDTWSACGGAF